MCLWNTNAPFNGKYQRWPSSQGKIFWYQSENFVTRNAYIPYESSSSHCSKVFSKVKVFKKWVKLQGQGHSVINNGTYGTVLSQGIPMWIVKASALTVKKLLARLKFQRGGQNDSDRILEWQTGQNNMPPDLRSRGHKNVWSLVKKRYLCTIRRSIRMIISCIIVHSY